MSRPLLRPRVPAATAPALLAAVAALLLPACSAADTVLQRVQPAEPGGPPTASIAVLAPLSGGQTRAGTDVVAAVEQAVADSGGVEGWLLDVQALDLAGGDLAATLERLDDDDTLVAVVTGFAPDDIRTVVPALDDAGFTVLSPADTDPRHVRGADPADPLRPWSGYLTVAVDPTPEQSALAAHLVRAADVTSVLVVTDGSAPAQSRAGALRTALQLRGVAAVEVVPATAEALTPAATQAVTAAGAGQAVVVDAPLPVAAAVAQARGAGSVLALMSRVDDIPPEQAAVLEGVLAPDRGPDPRRGVAELQAALAADGRAGTAGPYGPAAYDGARLLVDAFSRCLPDPTTSASPSRSACRGAVAGAQWSGLTGPVAFDEYGARLGLLPGVLSLRGGTWSVPGG